MMDKMQLMNIALFSSAMGLLCSHLAKKKGKRPFRWFFSGFFLGIFGVILLYIVPSFSSNKEKKKFTPPPQLERSDAWIKLWYYLDPQHEQKGPFEFPDFIEKMKGKQDAFVWGEGMKEWQKLGELPELMHEMQKGF